MKQLEEELGFAVFERAGRSVRLTAAGKVLSEQATRVLETFDDAVAVTRRVAYGTVGILNVGIIQGIVEGPLREFLLQFRKDYPTQELVYHDRPLTELIDSVDSGEMDVAFYLTDADRTGRGHKLFDPEQIYVAVPSEHPLAKEPVVTYSMLEDETLLISESSITGEELAQFRLKFLENDINCHTRVVTNYSVAISLVSLGVGVLLVWGQRVNPVIGVTYVPMPQTCLGQVAAYWIAKNRNPAMSLFAPYLESKIKVTQS